MSFFGDEHDAYPPDSPKHPTYADRMLEKADWLRKREREDHWRLSEPDDFTGPSGETPAATPSPIGNDGGSSGSESEDTA